MKRWRKTVFPPVVLSRSSVSMAPQRDHGCDIDKETHVGSVLAVAEKPRAATS